MVLVAALLAFPFTTTTAQASTATSQDPLFVLSVPQNDGYPPGVGDIEGGGRFILFAKDLNGRRFGGWQSYLLDRRSGDTRRVSFTLAGESARNVSFARFAGSPDAVIFGAEGSGLAPGVSRSQGQIYYKDLTTGELALVSAAEDGIPGNGSAGRPVIMDGRWVAFESDSDNLVPGDTNEHRDIFVKDLDTGGVQRVNTTSDGRQANDDCSLPVFVADEYRLAFTCYARNLVSNDTNRSSDCFLKDLRSGEVTRLSTSATGRQGNGGSYCLAASPTGRQVAITSTASNLVKGRDERYTYDTFVKRVASGKIRRILRGGAELVSADFSRAAYVQAVGRNSQVGVVNLRSGDTQLVGRNRSGSLPNRGAFAAAFSADARRVLLMSLSTNLGHPHRRGRIDMYLASVR